MHMSGSKFSYVAPYFSGIGFSVIKLLLGIIGLTNAHLILLVYRSGKEVNKERKLNTKYNTE